MTPPIDKVSFSAILIATDFSPASARALPHAVEMARRYGSKLYVAHVVPIESYLLGDAKAIDRLRQARQDAETNLENILRAIPHDGLQCEVLLDNGDIWGVLSEFISRSNADLLVLGTTGRTGLEKVLLGSVAEEAIREARCPVLTVGPGTLVESAARPRNILYATDFSPDSLIAAPYALSFTEKFRSHLTLLHAIKSIPESPYLDATIARVHLNKLVSQFNVVTVPDFVVELGSPASMILKVAADTASDLIVIGARGAGAIPRLAAHFGSIAHEVVSRAHCPVLTVGRSRHGLS